MMDVRFILAVLGMGAVTIVLILGAIAVFWNYL